MEKDKVMHNFRPLRYIIPNISNFIIVLSVETSIVLGWLVIVTDLSVLFSSKEHLLNSQLLVLLRYCYKNTFRNTLAGWSWPLPLQRR